LREKTKNFEKGNDQEGTAERGVVNIKKASLTTYLTLIEAHKKAKRERPPKE